MAGEAEGGGEALADADAPAARSIACFAAIAAATASRTSSIATQTSCVLPSTRRRSNARHPEAPCCRIATARSACCCVQAKAPRRRPASVKKIERARVIFMTPTNEEIRLRVKLIEDPARKPWVDEAMRLEGWEATEDRYVNFVYLAAVDGTPTALQVSQARQMARTQSGCSLVWEAMARSLRVAWPLLWKFYGLRFALPQENTVAACKSFAQASGAWVDASRWTIGRPLPGPADCLHIGGRGPAWVRGDIESEHVLTAVLRDGQRMHAIEGGQPGIRLRTRGIVEVKTTAGAELWLANLGASGAQLDAAGRPTRGRRVAGWIDPTRLPYRSENEVPTGIDLQTTLGLQRALLRLGFSPGPLDGKFGDLTRAAVVAYQRSKGLSPDGKVGPLTRGAISRDLGL